MDDLRIPLYEQDGVLYSIMRIDGWPLDSRRDDLVNAAFHIERTSERAGWYIATLRTSPEAMTAYYESIRGCLEGTLFGTGSMTGPLPKIEIISRYHPPYNDPTVVGAMVYIGRICSIDGDAGEVAFEIGQTYNVGADLVSVNNILEAMVAQWKERQEDNDRAQ